VRAAALYDVHGNLWALDAVLADSRVADADVIVCGGDLVAGPKPAECLDRLIALGDRVRFVRGNCDRETVDPPEEGSHAEVGRWSAGRLGGERLAVVEGWPLTVRLPVDGLGEVLFCHATPTADTPVLTSITPEDDVVHELSGVVADLIVCGHTHVQYDRTVRGVRLVNAGSVGMPYEGSSDARWALLDGDVQLVSTAYDAAGALADLAATGFPGFEEWFGPVGRGEISAEEATLEFERMRYAS
jgi:predicted phosphodiesterase